MQLLLPVSCITIASRLSSPQRAAMSDELPGPSGHSRQTWFQTSERIGQHVHHRNSGLPVPKIGSSSARSSTSRAPEQHRLRSFGWRRALGDRVSFTSPFCPLLRCLDSAGASHGASFAGES